PVMGSAQETTGRLVGKILDGEARIPIGGARIEVVGTTMRATSAVDGRYQLRDVPAGTITIKVSMIGYAPTTVTGVIITAGQAREQDVSLATMAVQLEELTVTAAA